MACFSNPPTPEEIQALSADFADIDLADIQCLIDRAACRVNEAYFGDCYAEAWALYAAHLAWIQANFSSTSSIQGSSTGSINKKKVGEMEITYGSSSNTYNNVFIRYPGNYGMSPFGMQYYDILESYGYKATPRVI